jgi:hypothetical protein
MISYLILALSPSFTSVVQVAVQLMALIISSSIRPALTASAAGFTEAKLTVILPVPLTAAEITRG